MPTVRPRTWRRVGNGTCPTGNGPGSTWPSRNSREGYGPVLGDGAGFLGDGAGWCASPGRSTTSRRGLPRDVLHDLWRLSDATEGASATHSGPRFRAAPLRRWPAQGTSGSEFSLPRDPSCGPRSPKDRSRGRWRSCAARTAATVRIGHGSDGYGCTPQLVTGRGHHQPLRAFPLQRRAAHNARGQWARRQRISSDL